jgi:hypothetical protein
MLVKNKKQIEKLINKNLPKFPTVEKHFKKLIKKLLKIKKSTKSLLEIPLIREMMLGSEAMKDFDGRLRSSEQFTEHIDRPISRINDNYFTEWGPAWSEISVANKLHEQGETEIEFSPRNSPFDIKSLSPGENQIIYTEVKGLDSIAPAFNILHDKMEAMSLLKNLFKKTFFVECYYPLEEIDDVSRLKPLLQVATDRLIKDLNKILKRGEILGKMNFKYGKINFLVNLGRTNKQKEFRMIFSKGGTYRGIGGDFIKMESVYNRVLSRTKKAYCQLLSNRGGDVKAVRNDRIFMMLNTGMENPFGDKKFETVIKNLCEAVGIYEIVNFEFIV